MTKPSLFVLAMALMLAQSSNGQTDTPKQGSENRPAAIYDDFGFRLSLGSELPHYSLSFYFLRSGTPIEPNTRIGLRRSGKMKILTGLNDLKGSVHITSPEAALKFVRLRTSPTTFYAWPPSSGVTEVEVARWDQYRRMPNYGDTRGGYSQMDKIDSGYLGALSPQAFAQGRFEMPQVRAVKHGYVIERWIYVTQWKNGNQINERVRKLREVVTPEGGYSRVVLIDKAAPALAGTDWWMPTYA